MPQQQPDVHDRSNGRIFKITYGETKTTRVDLQKESDDQLVTLLLDKHEWLSRHARRILEERAAAGKLDPKVSDELHINLGLRGLTMTARYADQQHYSVSSSEGQLRSLWALHVIGGLNEGDILRLLESKNPYVCAWAIQLACENGQPSEKIVQAFGELAHSDASPTVRLYLATAAQRIAPAQRWDIVAALHQHGEDAADHNLPLMDWYALEPMATADLHRTLAIGVDSKLPGRWNSPPVG
ncbi:MAG: hypothetical protein WDN28_15045 [Chthoniobacter sp.]